MCNRLGYSVLYNIYQNHSSSSTDYLYYLAWKMYDMYGGYWTDAGTVGSSNYTAQDVSANTELW